METDDYEEDLAVAERAAEWLIRLQDSTPAERKAFMCWLQQSPLHVREFLLVTACHGLLAERLPFLDREAKIFLAEARAGDVSLGSTVRDTRSRIELFARDEYRDTGARKRPHSLRQSH
jgi:ferric-dicitrate binding protein FerR (iron transport regulator)